MSDAQLFSEIATLPERMKEEVSDFVGYLKQKAEKAQPKKERVYGYSKGFFKIADGFDESLEDFKDYM